MEIVVERIFSNMVVTMKVSDITSHFFFTLPINHCL